MKSPLVSFVVLSWNTLEDTKTCLSNLAQLSHKNKEIIVVDNGSTDGSKNFLRKLPGITYINLPTNTGFTGGQIEGIKHCNGEYISLVNSDAVLAKDWTEVCLATFNDKTAAVGGKVFEWNEDSAAFDTSAPFYSYQKIDTFLGYAETRRSGESIIEVDSISGAAVMIRKSVIDTVGYFDNRFFAYFEETDLFARYQRAGYSIVYQPKAHAWHQIAKSTKSAPYFYLYHMHRNRFLFAFKNFDTVFGFVSRYGLDSIKAHWRYLKHKNMDDNARIDAFWWNAFHLLTSLKDRKRAQKLGKSYVDHLESRTEGDDTTIIIPSYNYAKYLPEAIESAQNQDHKPWKVLIIDDGSSDDSIAVTKKYNNIEVIAKKNEGVVATKNLGIKMSTTTWTLFLDADDVLAKDYLSKTLATAHKTKTSIIYTDMQFIGSKTGVFKAGTYKLKRLLEGNFIHNSALINTSLLKNSGGYKKEMAKGYEDWELYLTLAEMRGSFAYCNDTHLDYRQHEGSMSRNAEAIEVAEKLWTTARELHAPLYQRAIKDTAKRKKLLRQLRKHPLLPLVFVALIPYSLIKSLAGYYRSFRYNIEHGLRSYIHKKKVSDKQV